MVTNEGLKELAGLRSLSSLDLRDTRVTGEGLKELAGLKNLSSLDIAEGRIVDATLKARRGGAAACPDSGEGRGGGRPRSPAEVASLDLGDTRVTDEGLKEIAGFSNLSSLLLPHRVTDVGLKQLAGLKSSPPSTSVSRW